MASTTQAPTNVSNSSTSRQVVEYSGMIFPKSPMPAWVPAVSVAVVMLGFLTISFYIRHRKVMKKRQILMDYFYIIFQYGGLRRKRMVTALCNTNAITLSHLGRSFMISFDNNESSCPFFTDETAFTKPSMSSHFQSNGIAKAKNRLKIPFKRMMSQVEDNPVHEMLMKFKSKKKSSPSPKNKNNLAPPRRISLSSIHEDDSFNYSDNNFEYETTPRFKERRNAYVIRHSETDTTTSTNEMCSDGDDSELTNLFVEQSMSRRRSSVRRKSQIYLSTDEDGFRVLSPSSQNLRVLQLGASTSGKHSLGSSFRQPSRQGSKNEPLIFIQTASTDISSSQESDEIPAHCSKGVVVLRKMSRDQSSGDQYYVHESPVKYNQRKRKSLSTVSYVQSSNVNDYHQHILRSPKRSDDELNDEFSFEDEKQTSKTRSGRGWRKGGMSKKHSPHKAALSSQRRRTRLSLGDIGVGHFNFNRRIEESLGTMQEQDSEGGSMGGAKLSKDSSDEKNEKVKSSTTWKRLKNVFAGIRWSQGSGSSKLKQSKSSTSEDRLKIRNKRTTSSSSGKLNRFFSALTGFRSLPEDKKYCVMSPRGPKGSKSLPMGLDRRSFTLDDLEFHVAMSKQKKRSARPPSSCRSDVVHEKSNRKVPPKTRSFPDNIYLFQGGDAKPKPCLLHLHSDTSGATAYHRCTGRKCRRRSVRSEDHSKCHSSSNIDFIHSPKHLASFSESTNKSSHHGRSGSASPRSASPMAGKRCRRYRSLSPLPERRHFGSSPRKGKNVRWYSHSERNSLSEHGNPMSPTVRFNLGGGDTAFPFIGALVSGSSLDGMGMVNSCVKCSCEDLTNQFLEVRTEKPSEDNASTKTSDYVTINMEGISDFDANAKTTFVDIENTCKSPFKEDCCSVESDSVATNTGYLSVDSQSRSSHPSNDKTNSSTDSLYFDTCSVPSSPMPPLRTNALQYSPPSTNSLPSACNDVVASPTSSPVTSNSCDQTSPVLASLEENSNLLKKENAKEVSVIEDNTPSSKNVDDCANYVGQADLIMSVNKSIASSPVDSYTTVVDMGTTFEVCLDLPEETSPVIASPSHVPTSRICEDIAPMCSNDTGSVDELCDEEGPNADVFNESRVPLLRQATLEKQSSISSEEDKMTRLPRFGRRRSSQYASLFLSADTNNPDRKQSDEAFPLIKPRPES